MEIHDLKIKPLILAALGSLLIFPALLGAVVADGYVVKVENQSLYLDWGQSSGIAVGDTFEIYRSGEELKHPVSGASLGRSQSIIGQGLVESIEKKFSTARVIEAKGEIKAGDRTRFKSAMTVSQAPAPPVPTVTSLQIPPQNQALMPKEIWRSEPIKHEALGIIFADLDGDAKPEAIVAFANQIDVFRWSNNKLESAATFRTKQVKHLLAVDAADIDNAGRAKIFASYYMVSSRRAKTIVLEFTNGTLQEVATIDGFVRGFDRASGKRELVGQDLTMARELRVRPPAILQKVDATYQADGLVTVPQPLQADQLFGYTWGDWDGDAVEDFAVLRGGERLRITFKDSKWNSREVYGGTRADFAWEGERMGNLYPRMISSPGADGKNLLMVPHNVSSTPLSFARLKVYKESELVALKWNGLEMTPTWILSIAGAIADFGVADMMQNGKPQLWVAAVGSGNKSILLAYQLP